MTQVQFTNSTTTPIFIAYMRHNVECEAYDGKAWDVQGWVALQPGEVQTRSNPTGNRWFYYYAEATNGLIWLGSFPTRVRREPFLRCLGDIPNPVRSLYFDVGMRELDLRQHSGVRFTT